MRGFDWRIHRRLLEFALTAIFVAVVVAVRLALRATIGGESAFLLFLVAVMASAWLGGTATGLFATLLTALAANYFFITPRWSFGLGSFSQGVEFLLFVGEGTVTALLAGQLHRARDIALAKHAEAIALQSEVLHVSEGERRRIGHDLHDGLGQHLAGIALMTRGFQQRLAEVGSPEADEAQKMSQLARTAVEWTHDLCQSLSPDSAGLAQALKELASHANNIFNIECTLEQSGSAIAVDLQTSAHLYRIAQEAISNAVKHGKAKRVRICLQENTPSTVILQVIDDGCGIDPTRQTREGMGLRIMRYRAQIIGAKIEIQKHEARGTIVSCRFSARRYPEAITYDSN